MRRKSRAGQFVPNTGMARKVALDIARGLQYLHSRSPKVVHFDVKVPTPINRSSEPGDLLTCSL